MGRAVRSRTTASRGNRCRRRTLPPDVDDQSRSSHQPPYHALSPSLLRVSPATPEQNAWGLCPPGISTHSSPPVFQPSNHSRLTSQLLRLVQIMTAPAPIPIVATEAIYFHATFSLSGAYQDLAFCNYEQAARARVPKFGSARIHAMALNAVSS